LVPSPVEGGGSGWGTICRKTPARCLDRSRIKSGLVGEAGDDVDGLDAHPDHLPDELDDVFRVVLAVGVGDDPAPLVGGDLILVDHPLQGAPVAQSVGEDLGRDLVRSERRVYDPRKIELTPIPPN
jgi:hypothetical protein